MKDKNLKERQLRRERPNAMDVTGDPSQQGQDWNISKESMNDYGEDDIDRTRQAS